MDIYRFLYIYLYRYLVNFCEDLSSQYLLNSVHTVFIPSKSVQSLSLKKTSVSIGVSAHDSGSGDSDLLKSAISGLCARTAGDTAGGVLPRRNWDHDQWINRIYRKARPSHRLFIWFSPIFFCETNAGNPILPSFDQSAQIQSTGQSFLVHSSGNISPIWQTKKRWTIYISFIYHLYHILNSHAQKLW